MTQPPTLSKGLLAVNPKIFWAWPLERNIICTSPVKLNITTKKKQRICSEIFSVCFHSISLIKTCWLKTFKTAFFCGPLTVLTIAVVNVFLQKTSYMGLAVKHPDRGVLFWEPQRSLHSLTHSDHRHTGMAGEVLGERWQRVEGYPVYAAQHWTHWSASKNQLDVKPEVGLSFW